MDGCIDVAPSPDVVSLSGSWTSSTIGPVDIRNTGCGSVAGRYQVMSVVLINLTGRDPLDLRGPVVQVCKSTATIGGA